MDKCFASNFLFIKFELLLLRVIHSEQDLTRLELWQMYVRSRVTLFA